VPNSPFKLAHISVLSASHNVDEFDCGDPIRNSWLKTRAFSNHTNNDSRTYVVTQNGGQVCGFYAITTGSILRAALPGSLRRNAPDPVSCVILVQLGVTLSHQGQGLSRELMLHAMGQAVKVAEIVGCRLFVVHPATPRLTGYYKKFGFVEGVEMAPVSLMAMSLPKVRATLAAVEQAANTPAVS